MKKNKICIFIILTVSLAGCSIIPGCNNDGKIIGSVYINEKFFVRFKNPEPSWLMEKNAHQGVKIYKNMITSVELFVIPKVTYKSNMKLFNGFTAKYKRYSSKIIVQKKRTCILGGSAAARGLYIHFIGNLDANVTTYDLYCTIYKGNGYVLIAKTLTDDYFRYVKTFRKIVKGFNLI